MRSRPRASAPLDAAAARARARPSPRSSRASSASACASFSSRRDRASATTAAGSPSRSAISRARLRPGAPERQPVGRLVGVGVVAEGGAGDTRRRLRVGLHQAVVRRRDHHRAPRCGSARRSRRRARRPRSGRCPRRPRRAARARAARGRASSRRWPRGARRRSRGSRRSTARRRCRRRSAGRPAAGCPAPAGTCRPHCAMSAKQPDRLERDRLAAGVRAADHEHRRVAARRAGVTGTGSLACARSPSRSVTRGMQQRMARVEELDPGRAPPRSRAGARPSRRPAAPWPGRRRARPSRTTAWAMSSARSPHPRRQLLEDAHDLGALLVREGDDVVVQLDRRQRLDEEARARAGAAVDDARQLAASARP